MSGSGSYETPTKTGEYIASVPPQSARHSGTGPVLNSAACCEAPHRREGDLNEIWNALRSRARRFSFFSWRGGAEAPNAAASDHHRRLISIARSGGPANQPGCTVGRL